jgi:hypothetical protein
MIWFWSQNIPAIRKITFFNTTHFTEGDWLVYVINWSPRNVIVWSIGFPKNQFWKNLLEAIKSRYYQAFLYYVLLRNLLNLLPISCHESVLNAMTSQSLYRFFSNFLCFGSYNHPISVGFVATDLQLKHCSRLTWLQHVKNNFLSTTHSNQNKTDFWNTILQFAAARLARSGPKVISHPLKSL